MLSAEQKEQVHKTLYEYCKSRIPVQELTHAANEICNDPTQDTCDKMIRYLDQFDKEFVPLQTVDTKTIGKNEVRYGMAEVMKIIEAASGENTETE